MVVEGKLDINSVQVRAQNMELGLVLTKNNLLLRWIFFYDSQLGHDGFTVPPNFCLDMKFFKYGHVIYYWNGNFMLIKKTLQPGVKNEPERFFSYFSIPYFM